MSKRCINFATAPPCAFHSCRPRSRTHSRGPANMRISLLITVILALTIATSADARKAIATGTPAPMQRLLGCRAIKDNAQRLACFDRETEAVDQAISNKDMVLIDKARATAAKRSLFGFSVPDFGGLFGGNEDEVKEISSTVTAFAQHGYDGWTIRLADGSEW